MSEHLMGAGEIRDRLGRPSRQRVYQVTIDPSFPKPYDELQMGRVCPLRGWAIGASRVDSRADELFGSRAAQ